MSEQHPESSPQDLKLLSSLLQTQGIWDSDPSTPFFTAPIFSLCYLSYYCDKRPDKGTLGRQKEGSFRLIVSHKVQSVVEEKAWWQESEGNSPSSAAQVSTLKAGRCQLGALEAGVGKPDAMSR